MANNIGIGLNSSLKNRGIRNCLAHYGLGQFLSEDDVIEYDVLKGLTYKALVWITIQQKNTYLSI